MITADDVITDFNGDYEWVVTEEFVKQRNALAKKLKGKGKIRRADCTAAEYILAEHIESFELTPITQWHNDLQCKNTEEFLDAKQYAKIGVKVGDAPITNVKEGNIHYFPVWKWLPNNWYPATGPEGLVVDQKVKIRLLGLVPAQLAVENLYLDKESDKRFMFPEELNI